MVDLTIKDNKATGGGCGCGCSGSQDAAPQAQAATAEGTVATYTVSGMTCGHCVGAVTEEVSAIPGVSKVDVDLDSGALTIVSDAPVDFDRIVEAVAEAGDYTVA